MATIPPGFRARPGDHLEINRGPYPPGVPRRLTYPNVPANELLERATLHVPDHIAFHSLGHEWTYERLDAAAHQFAIWLQRVSKIQNGDRVGILLPNCPEYLVALNGIWKAGGVAVPINPLSSPEALEQVCLRTNCRSVVCLDLFTRLLPNRLQSRFSTPLIEVSLEPYQDHLANIGYRLKRWFQRSKAQETLSFSEILNAAGTSSELVPVERIPASDPACILSTGGTTGNPKLVTLSHRNIVANAWQQLYWLGQSYSAGSAASPRRMGRESMLAVLPFFHSYGLSTMVTTGCVLGAKLVILPRFSVRNTLDVIERQSPSVFYAVPEMLSAMNRELARRDRDLSSIKWVISGGAPLSTAVAKDFRRYSNANVVEGYGLSEASSLTHLGPLNSTNRPGTIGMPLPDTECRVVDTHGRNLMDGEVGELLVRGPQVMLGYWGDPKATRTAIRDGWLYTGDLARCVDGSFYQFVDLKQDLIRSSGFHVYPADVEAVLRECDDVSDVAVVGMPDKHLGEVIVAYVVLKKGKRRNLAKLEKFSQSRLARHRQPQRWMLVPGDLPRDYLGKVRRRELRVMQRGFS